MRLSRLRSTAGFSLVEMLIVVAVIGLMMLLAWPRITAIYDRSQVRGARNVVINKFNTARIQARQSGMTTRFQQNGNLVWVERDNGLGGWVTVGGVQNMNAVYGVTIPDVNMLTIDPRGLAQGTPITIRMGRAGIRDSVVFSGYGGISR
ncbi:MAG: pilus assembly FimT family protein [Gemmatimonadales bacterium]